MLVEMARAAAPIQAADVDALVAQGVRLASPATCIPVPYLFDTLSSPDASHFACMSPAELPSGLITYLPTRTYLLPNYLPFCLPNFLPTFHLPAFLLVTYLLVLPENGPVHRIAS